MVELLIRDPSYGNLMKRSRRASCLIDMTIGPALRLGQWELIIACDEGVAATVKELVARGGAKCLTK